MMEFMLGCNYWESQSGTEMWRAFNEKVIDDDFKRLSEYGARVLRVFPNWRDFQPIISLKTYLGGIKEYCFTDERPLDNEFGLDKLMIERFARMCELAEKHDIKLIVSIVTGWMSGRLFIPPAIEGKNIITDSEALMWQEKYVRGFVRSLKNQNSIFAWDLGNECNCMGKAEIRAQTYLWSAIIRNAIKAEDSLRPIMSGLHGLSIYETDPWSMQDQGALTDWMTPHPYCNSWNGGETDPMNRLKSTYLPTIQAQLYSDIGGKPSIIQEQGGLNQVYGSDELDANFLRVNVLSSWAAGTQGYLWWCAFDQLNLDFFPYSYSMRELGAFKTSREPKLNAIEMKRMDELLRSLPFSKLPPRDIDAVCVLSILDKPWQVASNTALLAKQAGVEITFRNYRQEVPQAKLYLLPCIEGWNVTTKRNFSTLLQRVREGAVLYVSYNGGVLENFEEVFGLKSMGLQGVNHPRQADFAFGEETVTMKASHTRELLLMSNGAEILAKNEDNNPVFTKYQYGKGTVFFLNFALERMLWDKPGAFSGDALPYYKIYQEIAAELLTDKLVTSQNSQIGITQHKLDQNHAVIVAINYSDKPQPLNLKIKDGWSLKSFYGSVDDASACDGCIFQAYR